MDQEQKADCILAEIAEKIHQQQEGNFTAFEVYQWLVVRIQEELRSR